MNTIDSPKKLLEAMNRASEMFKLHRDEHHANQLHELIDKHQTNALHIAFCGHFSAGKSSLLNRLCGAPLLPSSPIPTSANIVCIRHGEPLARVTYRQSGSDTTATPLPEARHVSEQAIRIDELEAFCKNGVDIEKVDVFFPMPWLTSHGVLMDTPGIDSTDDTHQLATQSALHLADIVFFVMDYNYVQSNMNFSFVKKMHDRSKPVYVIVNMIDKHKSHELSFADFRQMTEDACRQYGLDVQGFLYISTKNIDDSNSEWESLTELIQQLLEQREPFIMRSTVASFRYFMEQHVQQYSHQQDMLRLPWKSLAGEDSDRTWLADAESWQLQIEQWQQEAEQVEIKMRQEITRTIDNANITPALTRDRALAYLEATRSNFRVGLFARASQKEAEVDRRTQVFKDDFAEQIQAQLDWHVQALLKKEAQRLAIYDHELIPAIDHLRFELTTPWLRGHIQAGAEISSTYMLNYMKQVAADCKQILRRQTYAVLELLVAKIREKNQQAIVQAQAQIATYAERLNALHEWQRLDEQEHQHRLTCTSLCEGPWTAAYNTLSFPQVARRDEVSSLDNSSHSSEPATRPPATSLPTTNTHEKLAQVNNTSSSEQVMASPVAEISYDSASLQVIQAQALQLAHKASQLQQAAKLIDDITSMKSNAIALRHKAERLTNRTFTIALFGAFSAGKSSFANALLGKRVLPVSPNPTTAAINRIRYPQQDWPHASAKVKMKSAEVILQDVQYSLHILGYEVTNIGEALKLIRNLVADRIPSKGKAHYSFLRAVEAGWRDAEPQLGQELKITSEQFADYVSQERVSCFVEVVDYYEANPWTEQGIILVDTPGADSINARHTDVAFTYIKNADAILFITYYNHAFSQADREFLLQLGRVKDSFEMDKMFFVVNASDLASSQAECMEVVRHVESNLLQHGIRNPRIYPVSSDVAIESKLQANAVMMEQSGMSTFEADFVQFTVHEMQDMALHGANQEVRRATLLLDQWLDAATNNEQQRQVQIKQLHESCSQAIRSIDQIDATPDYRELRIEIQELLYYVKQRTMFRYGELYNMAFHPSTFRELAHDVKQALRLAWEELVRRIHSNLTQEVLATTLRIENKMNALARHRLHDVHQAILHVLPHIEFTIDEPHEYATPQLLNAFEIPEVNEKTLLRFFKNSKFFFEGEGKSWLRNELEQLLTQQIESWMSQQVAELDAIYAPMFAHQIAFQMTTLKLHISEYEAGMLEALSMSIDIEQLTTIRRQLVSLVDGS